MDLSVKQKTKLREDLGIEVGSERNWLEATLDIKPIVFTYLLAADNWTKSRIEKIYKAGYVLGHMIMCNVDSSMEGGYKGLSMSPVFVLAEIAEKQGITTFTCGAVPEEPYLKQDYFRDGLGIDCGITFFAKTFEFAGEDIMLAPAALGGVFQTYYDEIVNHKDGEVAG